MDEKTHLLRILGVGFGVAVTVGTVVGVGILRTPGLVAAQLPWAWAIVGIWLLGGLYSLLGTISVVELGTMLPKAGGWYVYARRAFGDYGGFTVGWIDWLAQSSSIAYLTTAIGELTVALVPAVPGGIKGVAVGITLFFALVHWLGLRSSSWAQDLTSLVKGVAFAAFVAVCFLYGNRSDVSAAAVPTPSGFFGIVTALVIALQAVIITYDGWYAAIYFVEEDKDPARNLPRSAIGGVSSTIAIYLLVNLALLYTLSMTELTGSDLPAIDAARKIWGEFGRQVITALSLVAILSVVNATLLLTTRILFAMARDGLFFAGAARVHRRGTPLLAMSLTSGASIFLVATGTFETLIAVAAPLFVIGYLSGFVSLFVLRKREPNLERPFRVWGYPWVPAIVLVGSVLFLVANVVGDPKNSLFALVLIVLSYPAFLAINRRREV